MSIKMQIPEIGDSFILSKDWTFKLYAESRNAIFWTTATEQKYDYKYHRENKCIEFTFPKGTELKVDRIYIRQGAQAYSSITFRTVSHPIDNKFAKKRFWAKLHDVNKIIMDEMKETTPQLIFNAVPNFRRGSTYYDFQQYRNYIPIITSTIQGQQIPFFKVNIKVDYKEEKVLIRGIIKNKLIKEKVISVVNYILCDMNDIELANVNTYDAMKKKSKELFEEIYKGVKK